MDSEFQFLKRRADFHRQMSHATACPEARCVHEAFVRAYTRRMEALPGYAAPPRGRPSPDEAAGPPLPSLAATVG